MTLNGLINGRTSAITDNNWFTWIAAVEFAYRLVTHRLLLKNLELKRKQTRSFDVITVANFFMMIQIYYESFLVSFNVAHAHGRLHYFFQILFRAFAYTISWDFVREGKKFQTSKHLFLGPIRIFM